MGAKLWKIERKWKKIKINRKNKFEIIYNIHQQIGVKSWLPLKESHIIREASMKDKSYQ